MIERPAGQRSSLRVAEAPSSYGPQRRSEPEPPTPPVPCFCNVCSHEWTEGAAGRRFRSIDDLIQPTGLRRDELTVLAEIGALNALGYDRRSALWQVERPVRPAGSSSRDRNWTKSVEQADRD